MSKVQVSSMYVELIQILGRVLRKNLKMCLRKAESWDVEHVADWGIYGKQPDSDASEEAWFNFHQYENPIHEMHTYLASGKCSPMSYGDIKGRTQDVEIRVRAEFSKWIAVAQSYWDIEMWVMVEGGTVQRYHFHCSRGYGEDRDIYEQPLSAKMKDTPPKKIKFPPIEKMQTPDWVRRCDEAVGRMKAA